MNNTNQKSLDDTTNETDENNQNEAPNKKSNEKCLLMGGTYNKLINNRNTKNKMMTPTNTTNCNKSKKDKKQTVIDNNAMPNNANKKLDVGEFFNGDKDEETKINNNNRNDRKTKKSSGQQWTGCAQLSCRILP